MGGSTDASAASVIWDPAFVAYGFGPEHPFTQESRRLAVRLLEASLTESERSSIDWLRTVAPAERSVLERFHDSRYVDRVRAVGAGSDIVFLDHGDTPGLPGCYEAAARVAAGTVAAVERAWERRSPSFQPAGGLHHAHPDRASGFCIFNDVAVAIAPWLLAGRRIAYIDLDAHHGDGVMYGFYGSGRLLDIDFHQDGRTLFPGTGAPDEVGAGDGARRKVNVPLPPRAGDEALGPLFRRIVPTLLDDFRPELIVLQHGVDGHAGDALAQLQYTPSVYEEIDRFLIAYAREQCDGRLVVTGGGGYRPAAVARVLARAGRLLAGLPSLGRDRATPAEWRVDFFETFGEAAPERWAEPEKLLASTWSAESEERLIADLESAIGLSFPARSAGGER